ncbi:MAG: glycosyltransferase [Caldilineaceae bacterium]
MAYLVPWKDTLVPHFVAAGVPVWSLGAGGQWTGDRRQWTVDSGQGRIGSGEQTDGVTPARSWQSAVQLPVAHARLRRLVKREGISLIHADMPVAGILARLVGKQTGVPVVYTEHNLIERYHPLTRWVHRATFGWQNCVLTVSDEVQASIQRMGGDRQTTVRTLLNGVPVEQVRREATALAQLRAELAIPADHTIVGSVAVFRAQKRLADWLAVAAQVAAHDERVTFLLVGDGPEMATVRARVAALGLTDRVRLPGFRADGRRYLGLMDIYLMSSQFEGLPIALLEAMALGKPVVATTVGGIPEAVTDGQEGLLAAVGAVDALAAAVRRLVASAEERARLGAAGAARVDAHFHLRHRVAAIEATYREILEFTKAPEKSSIIVS